MNLAEAQLPNPVLTSVFPPGGQAGQTVDVTVAGRGLDGLRSLRLSHPAVTFKQDAKDKKKFRVTIRPDTPPGLYDLRSIGTNGLSSARAFFVSNRSEFLETEPNDTLETPQSVSLEAVINGRIEKGGDLDRFQFSAKRGQRVIIECWAERIDSPLRAVLEVYDSAGRRLAINRGFFGIDPLIDFRVPADGRYTIKLFDLIYSGSADHFYRLDVGTGPRVAFTVPAVVERGKQSRVMLYGWNLSRNAVVAQTSGTENAATTEATSVQNEATASARLDLSEFDRLEVEITPPVDLESRPLPVRLRPSQVEIDGFAYHLPGSHVPVFLSVTDVPVVADEGENHSPGSAQELSFPSEVSGQLIGGNEQDWFSFRARRGEVLWFEAFGDRIDSPVDLEIGLLDASGSTELARFGDRTQNIGGTRFPSNHLDPAGRWVVPADGKYLILLRNLIGGLDENPRCVYRLSVRREELEFHLAMVPRVGEPSGLNVTRGGRTVVDVLAFRGRGLTGPIRVRAIDLPTGIVCPDVWLGPAVNSVPLTISADRNAEPFVGTLKLEGIADIAGTRGVRGGTMVRKGLPNGWGRLTAEIPLAVAGHSPIRITADGHETRKHHLYGEMKVRHSPGSTLDVAIHVEREDVSHAAPVKLIGVGLPNLIRNQTATIPAGKNKGYISFHLPSTLPVGRYTIGVQASTTAAFPSKGGKASGVTVFSNPVSFEVKPAAFIVEVDHYAPKKIQRGKVVTVNYTAKRINGFITKIHTELAAAEEVIGIRGRGVTFVGQTESGTIQIIANDDAPLGQQPFLRLFAVGVLEDQPVFHGSTFLNLEIVE